jgi:succinate dehydrogenase / fumarate reductase flavoprotein subunit
MHSANVLVIGTGAAGLRAALAADAAGAEVVVVGKRPRFDPHTALASGGINAALGTRDPDDCWQQHAADTLREGYWLSDPRVVETVAREAPAAVEELAAWGCDFALRVRKRSASRSAHKPARPDCARSSNRRDSARSGARPKRL